MGAAEAPASLAALFRTTLAADPAAAPLAAEAADRAAERPLARTFILAEEFKFALWKKKKKVWERRSSLFSFPTFVRPCLSFLLACFLFSKYKKRFFFC